MTKRERETLNELVTSLTMEGQRTDAEAVEAALTEIDALEYERNELRERLGKGEEAS